MYFFLKKIQTINWYKKTWVEMNDKYIINVYTFLFLIGRSDFLLFTDFHIIHIYKRYRTPFLK